MTDEELLARADAIAARAYAPYSGFHVGCAVLTRDGKVSRASTSRTPPIRSASAPSGRRSRARSSRATGRGTSSVAAITASPCGGCRQWLAEMQVERVVFRNGGRVVRMTVDELLPEQFDAGDLA